MTYNFMAYIVMAYMPMAYTLMTYIVTAYSVMANIVMAYKDTASGRHLQIFMALCSYGQHSYGL